MDYGVYLKKEFKNPNRRSVHYTKQSKFEGSNRQVRGMILRLFTTKNKLTIAQLCTKIARDKKTIIKNLLQLEKEGFLRKNHSHFSLN